ncbi:MAG: ATP-grasp domain-containing protein [Verrucomicrobiales bacterium]
MKLAESSKYSLEGVTVIVPLADEGLCLRMMRCLGQHGARFVLVSRSLDTAASKSRYCERLVHLAGSQSDQAWVNCLDRIEIDGDAAVLLPVTTAGFQFVARNRVALSSRFHLPPLAEESSLRLASDKWSLFELADKVGLPVIRSVAMNAESVAEIADGTDEFPFPLLIKPTRREHGRGFRKCDSAGELRSFYRETAAGGQEDYLIQPFLDGYDVSVSAFCSSGRVRAHATWEAQYYGGEHYTIPRCIEFKDGGENLEIASSLLAHLDWEGVCDIDLFVDRRTGKTFLLEVNARFWANVIACSVAGVNFPLLMCLAALDRTPQRWPTQVDETVFCHPRGLPRLLTSRKNFWRAAKHPLSSTGLDRILVDPFPEVYKARRRICRSFSRSSLRQTRSERASSDSGSEWVDSTGSAHLPR